MSKSKSTNIEQMTIDLASLPVMSCLTDHLGQISYVNELFKQQLQTGSSVVDQNIADIFAPNRTINSYLTKAVEKQTAQLNLYISNEADSKARFIATTQLLNPDQQTSQILWLIIDVTKYHLSIQQKEQALKELDNLNNKLVLERDYLRNEQNQIRDLGDMVGSSPALLQMVERIKSVAQTDASVLITGESGSGKELVARLIHQKSERRDAPLVTVNCASIPSELFESEFFGHIKGAFSGAVQDRIGRFELANKGTLFLDEVGEIPIGLQSKLLRAIQQKSFERVGDNKTRDVDVRIIAATNRNLEDEVEQGLFREDLYYRLSVFPISVPALRKRKGDIVPLAQYFVELAKVEFAKQVGSFTTEQLAMLRDYDWPGNIRELKNVIERAVILSDGHIRLDLALPEQALRQIGNSIDESSFTDSKAIISDKTLKQIERRNLINALEKTQWRVSGDKGAAKLLEMNPSTLNSKIKAFAIQKPDKNALYNRIGGIHNITSIVNELLARLRSDSELGRHWQDRGIDSIRMEKKFLIDYLCDLTGGPYKYTGRDMLSVHKGMGINDQDWQGLCQHFIAVLSNYQIQREDAEELLDIVEREKSLILES